MDAVDIKPGSSVPVRISTGDVDVHIASDSANVHVPKVQTVHSGAGDPSTPDSTSPPAPPTTPDNTPIASMRSARPTTHQRELRPRNRKRFELFENKKPQSPPAKPPATTMAQASPPKSIRNFLREHPEFAHEFSQTIPVSPKIARADPSEVANAANIINKKHTRAPASRAVDDEPSPIDKSDEDDVDDDEPDVAGPESDDGNDAPSARGSDVEEEEEGEGEVGDGEGNASGGNDSDEVDVEESVHEEDMKRTKVPKRGSAYDLSRGSRDKTKHGGFDREVSYEDTVAVDRDDSGNNTPRRRRGDNERARNTKNQAPQSSTRKSASFETPRRRPDSRAREDDGSGNTEREQGGGDDDDICEEEKDDMMERMRLVDIINENTTAGLAPPQIPSMDMPKEHLERILRFQEEKAAEIITLGHMGMVLVSIVGLLEDGNEKMDPFQKMFGYGLKLKGATDSVREALPAYRLPFLKMYRDMKRKGHNLDLPPWAQVLLITGGILKSVHTTNVYKELHEQTEKERVEREASRRASSTRPQDSMPYYTTLSPSADGAAHPRPQTDEEIEAVLTKEFAGFDKLPSLTSAKTKMASMGACPIAPPEKQPNVKVSTAQTKIDMVHPKSEVVPDGDISMVHDIGGAEDDDDSNDENDTTDGEGDDGDGSDGSATGGVEGSMESCIPKIKIPTV